MQHKGAIPFDVAGSLVEAVIKEAVVIDRLYALLSQHLSSEEMAQFTDEIKETADFVKDIIGPDAFTEV